MGAEVKGVDLAAVTDEQFAEIEHALFRHKMIFFRDQRINHADHESFSLRFGDFADDAYTKGVEGHVNIQPVIKEAGTEVAMIFGSGWHTDSAFLPDPPAISMLYGVDIPPYGGDTIWANAALAYATLSEAMRAMIAGLAGAHVDARPCSLGAGADGARRHRHRPAGRHPRRRAARPGHRGEGQRHRPPARAHAPGDRRAGAVLRQDLRPMHRGAWPRRSRNRCCGSSPTISRNPPSPAACAGRRARSPSGTTGSASHQAFNDHDGYRRELYRTTVAGEVPA